YPKHMRSSEYPLSSNVIGTMVEPPIPMFGYPEVPEMATVSVGGGAPFGFPHVLMSLPDGTVINDAKIELKIPNLIRVNYSQTTTIINAETGETETTGSYEETTEGIAINLIGGKVVD